MAVMKYTIKKSILILTHCFFFFLMSVQLSTSWELDGNRTMRVKFDGVAADGQIPQPSIREIREKIKEQGYNDNI